VEIAKPRHVGIGIDALPEWIRTSPVLTGNDLARLAGVERLPDNELLRNRWREYLAADSGESSTDFEAALEHGDGTAARDILVSRIKVLSPNVAVIAKDLHRLCRVFLRAGDIEAAWECAWMGDTEKLKAVMEHS